MIDTPASGMNDESDGRAIETPTTAVTGAAGYIGSRVVVELQEAYPDWEFVAIDNQYRRQVDSIGDVDIEHVDI